MYVERQTYTYSQTLAGVVFHDTIEELSFLFNSVSLSATRTGPCFAPVQLPLLPPGTTTTTTDALLSCYRKCGAHARHELLSASGTAKVQVGRVRVRHERKARVPQVPDKGRLNASCNRLAAAWHPETHETHTPSAQPRTFPVRGDTALGRNSEK